jgi:hypothetical protein
MSFGFGKKKDEDRGQESLDPGDTIEPLDDDDYKEIEKIKEMLNPYEDVVLVARQSRVLPGGSYVTPNIIYATTKRLILD